jgi:hypothetical protein
MAKRRPAKVTQLRRKVSRQLSAALDAIMEAQALWEEALDTPLHADGTISDRDVTDGLHAKEKAELIDSAQEIGREIADLIYDME